MSADVINLRRARKAKARAEQEKSAAKNRRVFGRSKVEKQRDAAERTAADRHLDAHRREDE